MDEKETLDQPPEDMSEPPSQPPATPLKTRFAGFAVCYILYSFVFFFLFLIALVASAPYAVAYAPNMEHPGIPLPTVPLLIFGLVSMLPYFPLGMLAAKLGRWSVPSTREVLLFIVWPSALFAVWLMLLRHGASSLLSFTPAFLAAPPFYFAVFSAVVFAILGVGWLTPVLSPLLAAVLPPLLFALGSFWQAKRQNYSSPT